LWAFIGLESATVPADDVKDPRRTIPRATLIGTLAATAVYIVSTVAIMGIITTGELARSTSPFADAAGVIFGGGWDNVIAVVALISTAGALNGWILLQGQVPLAAARDGLFPRQFARLHGERQTPVFGLVVSSVLVSGLLLTNYTKGLVGAFTFVILLATLTALVPYAYSAAAQVMLLVNEPQAFQGRRLARDAAIAALAFAYSIWAIAGAGDDVIAKGFVLLLAGIPIYLWLSWRKRRAPEHLPLPEREKVIAGAR
jgi:basic amino acid/polyamine antiporter, APA family